MWSELLFNTSRLQTVNREEVVIEDTGVLNRLSGPDFHEAKIRIGDTLWAGSVEIHIKSSDWFKHNHEPDKAYGNVILHVVFEHDIVQDGFSDIPILELKGRIKRSVLSKYEQLKSSKNGIACKGMFDEVGESVKFDALERCALQRLERKSREIKRFYQNSKGDIDQTFFAVLARNFGFKWNAQAFEELAVRTSFSVVRKYTHDLQKTEALLLGQAGFLPQKTSRPEVEELNKEYAFLKNKHQLKPASIAAWKRGGVRPPNFPEIRIAQLAAFYNRNPRIASEFEYLSADELLKIFDVSASAFWDDRFTLEKKSEKHSRKIIAKGSRRNILINTAAPFLYFLGRFRDRPELCEKAVLMLEKIPPEKNNVISKWNSLNLTMNNALHSQGALTLYNNYCKKVKCADCEIGKRILE